MGRAFEFRKERKFKRWGHMARVFTKIGKEITIAVKQATWQSFVQDATLVWVAVVALVLGIIAYDKLLDGAVFVVKKALDKSKFVQ